MKAWQFFMQTYQNDYSVLWPSKFGTHSAFCSLCQCDFSIARTSHGDIVHHTTVLMWLHQHWLCHLQGHFITHQCWCDLALPLPVTATVLWHVSADVTSALPLPITVTLFITHQCRCDFFSIGRATYSDIVHHKFHIWYNRTLLTWRKPPGYLLHVCFVLCLCRDFVDWLEKGFM